MVCVALITCFKDTLKESFAGTEVPLSKATPFRLRVTVEVDAAVLLINISVTTVVVADGTVYRVVEVVAAAVRARTLDVTAISYCAFP